MFDSKIEVSSEFQRDQRAVIFPGDCTDLLATIPNESIQLVVTSPHNIGKEYERRLHLDEYVAQQRQVIAECYRWLRGQLCAIPSELRFALDR